MNKAFCLVLGETETKKGGMDEPGFNSLRYDV